MKLQFELTAEIIAQLMAKFIRGEKSSDFVFIFVRHQAIQIARNGLGEQQITVTITNILTEKGSLAAAHLFDTLDIELGIVIILIIAQARVAIGDNIVELL